MSYAMSLQYFEGAYKSNTSLQVTSELITLDAKDVTEL
jgi:hypothetical protein